MQVSHGGAREDRINLLIFSLCSLSHSKSVSVTASFLHVLLPSSSICSQFVPQQVEGVESHIYGCVCFMHVLVFLYAKVHALKALWCVRAKPPANYNLNSSISSEQADRAVQMSPGHYHRLSCSSKPEVTTAPSVCRACTGPSKAYG